MKTLEELKSIERIVTTETALITNSNGTFTMKTLLDQLITVQSALEELVEWNELRLGSSDWINSDNSDIGGWKSKFTPCLFEYLKQKEATDDTQS